MMQLSAAITAFAVSDNAFAANITVATIAYKSVLVIDLTSANTTSRHSDLLKVYIILLVFPKENLIFT